MLEIVLTNPVCMFEVTLLHVWGQSYASLIAWGITPACILTWRPFILTIQISDSICRNETPNLQGTSTMLPCCLQTLLYVVLSSPFGFLALFPCWSYSHLVCNSSTKTTFWPDFSGQLVGVLRFHWFLLVPSRWQRWTSSDSEGKWAGFVFHLFLSFSSMNWCWFDGKG